MSAPTSLILTLAAAQQDNLNSIQAPVKSNDSQLIDNKFNELAKKILEEFKQAQYSREFFQALDEILKEPAKKSFTLKSRRAPGKNIRQFKYYSNLQQARQQQQQIRNCSDQQPRSLPAEVAKPTLQQKQRQLQQLQKSPLKSAIPTISNGLIAKSPKNSTGGDERSSGGYQISRSATIGAADTTTNLRRQQQMRKLSTQSSSLSRNHPQVSDREKVAAAVHATSLGIAQRRLKAHSPSAQQQSGIRRLVAHDDFCGEDDIDDDDEDVDDEEDDDDYNIQDRDTPNDRPMSFVNNHYKPHNQQTSMTFGTSKLNPIVKSKTLSDATNISEMNMLTKRQASNTNNNIIKQGQQQQLQQTHNNHHQRPRFNPIVRSNTVSSNASHKADQERKDSYLQKQDSEPKSIVLNGKDFGSLWKPHMNYSTSMLGNPRLSDDDEIIIIPTQSPSFVSPSPDGQCETHAEDMTERFSISRTKSFWEKLSKGSPGKRSSNETSDGPARSGSRNQVNGKVLGVKSNGLSRTLDRMDSTGGSNSNYSCSSSGDENSGCHSQQNPTASQLQEMSRQNRLRQTR